MGCRGQRLLWSWVLWGLWVLPGKCRGHPHRCRANQVADGRRTANNSPAARTLKV